MTAINFDRDIDAEGITWLIEQINLSSGKILIYMRSDGGDADAIESFVDFVNKIEQSDKERDITLIAFGHIMSAAFITFFKIKCKRQILPGTWAMTHKIRITLDTNEEDTPMIKEQKRGAQNSDNEIYNFLKTSRLIPANDLKNFSAFKDVIISYDKLCQLFDRNEI